MQLKLITTLIVLFLVLASLLVSGCTTSRNEQTTQSSSNTQTSSQNTPTVSVTATYLGSENSLPSLYGGTPTAAASGYKFVKYAVYFENINAKDAQMGNAGFFRLRDTAGNIYSYDSWMFVVEQQVNGVTLKGVMPQMNTQPGDKYSGLIIFQIPTSATPKSLTYDDYTNRITINL